MLQRMTKGRCKLQEKIPSPALKVMLLTRTLYLWRTHYQALPAASHQRYQFSKLLMMNGGTPSRSNVYQSLAITVYYMFQKQMLQLCLKRKGMILNQMLERVKTKRRRRMMKIQTEDGSSLQGLDQSPTPPSSFSTKIFKNFLFKFSEQNSSYLLLLIPHSLLFLMKFKKGEKSICVLNTCFGQLISFRINFCSMCCYSRYAYVLLYVLLHMCLNCIC